MSSFDVGIVHSYICKEYGVLLYIAYCYQYTH